MIDTLNSFLFSTPEMAEVFSPAAQLRAMMRFEWALIQALERNGLAARGSADEVVSQLDCEFVNMHELQQHARKAGNAAIPFVRQLTAAVKQRNEGAAHAIHLGATS